MPNEEPKAKSKSVSLPHELWAQVEATAEENYTSNRSAYLRDLIERDLRGLSIGTPQSTFSAEQVSSWVRSERAVIAAAKHALKVLDSQEAAERESAARTLATLIIEANFPAGAVESAAAMLNEPDAMAAEEQARRKGGGGGGTLRGPRR